MTAEVGVLTRRIIGVLFVVASLAGFLAPSVQAVPRHRPESTYSRIPLAVKISRAHARIGADGSVPVVVFARCRAGLNAFELDVSIRQGAVFGADAATLGPVLATANVLTGFSFGGNLYTLFVRPLLPDEVPAPG